MRNSSHFSCRYLIIKVCTKLINLLNEREVKTPSLSLIETRPKHMNKKQLKMLGADLIIFSNQLSERSNYK